VAQDMEEQRDGLSTDINLQGNRIPLPAHGRLDHFQLQPPLGAQEPDEPAVAPLAIDAKVESFSSTFLLLHTGQTTSDITLARRTNFSNSTPQSRQANSNIGILEVSCFYLVSLLGVPVPARR
jgi:hypothetical protein